MREHDRGRGGRAARRVRPRAPARRPPDRALRRRAGASRVRARARRAQPRSCSPTNRPPSSTAAPPQPLLAAIRELRRRRHLGHHRDPRRRRDRDRRHAVGSTAAASPRPRRRRTGSPHRHARRRRRDRPRRPRASARATGRRPGDRSMRSPTARSNLRRGEVGALLGRSGSGKSTLLAILAGLQQPDAGELDLAVDPRPSLGGARVPPPTLRAPPRTLDPREHRVPRATPGNLAEHATASSTSSTGSASPNSPAPTPRNLDRPATTRSARPRARARPTILLADEPTSHQDAGWRDAVWELLVDTAESGTGCLIATHEDQIAQYANRVWTIDGGAIGTKR